jgi:hypothetical protein
MAASRRTAKETKAVAKSIQFKKNNPGRSEDYFDIQAREATSASRREYARQQKKAASKKKYGGK